MKTHLSKLSFLIIGLSLAATVSYLNAWTGPTQTAPAGNVSAPLNTSVTSQAKNAATLVGSTLNIGGILSSDQLLAFTRVSAGEYCDVNGENCATPPLASSVNGSMPAGSVVYMASSNCPSGFLLANGASLNRTTYAGLFAVIGTTFGTASSTEFNIPDLRGYFIRSNGTNSDGTASGAFGVKQTDMFKTHTHTGTTNTAGAHTHSYSYPNVPNSRDADAGSNDTNAQNNGNSGGNTGSSGSHNHSVSITANTDGGGTETRPDNISLTACIKF